MDTSKLMNLAIAGGILFAAHKFGNAHVKGGATAIAAVIVAKQLPYLRDYI